MTVNVRKLTKAQATKLAWTEPKSAFIMTEYFEALKALKPGDVAVIDIPEGDTDKIVKARAARAASRLGYRLLWAKNYDSVVLAFRVVRREEAAAD